MLVFQRYLYLTQRNFLTYFSDFILFLYVAFYLGSQNNFHHNKKDSSTNLKWGNRRGNWIVGGANNSVACYISPLALHWAEGFGFQKTTGFSGMRCISPCTCLKDTWGEKKIIFKLCQHYWLMCHRLPVPCSSVEITLFYLWALHVASEIWYRWHLGRVVSLVGAISFPYSPSILPHVPGFIG